LPQIINNPSSIINAEASSAKIGFVLHGAHTVDAYLVKRISYLASGARESPFGDPQSPMPAVSAAGGDSAGRGVGLRLFDVHSYSPIMLSSYHTRPWRPVKQKPGFLAAEGTKVNLLKKKGYVGTIINNQSSLVNYRGCASRDTRYELQPQMNTDGHG
jgi:hypothetical protein